MAIKRFPDDYSEKITIANADKVCVADSASSDALVYILFSTIKSNIQNINSLTEKTSIANNDELIINDSADSNNPKKVKFSTIDLLPIGSIIPIHPEINVSKAIDTNRWKLCDSTGDSLTITYHDGTTDSITRPDLSDDRFLMGDNVASATTGGNNSNAHTHTTDEDTHNHKWYEAGTGAGIRGRIKVTANQTTGSQLYDSGGNGVDITFDPIDIDCYTVNDTHSHTTDSQSVTENRPKFFSVLYYFRIN